MTSEDSAAFLRDDVTGMWQCIYCIDDQGIVTDDKKEAHGRTRRHLRLRQQYIEQGNSARGCIERNTNGALVWWMCKICMCRVDNHAQIDGHLVGMKHRRCLKRQRWYSSSTDPECDPPMVVHCIGDSHGGKYLFQSMSPRVRCHFIAGTMHTFATGRRVVDLRKLGIRSEQAVLFSYGEIDVRCHVERLAKIRDCGFDAVISALVALYIKEILRLVQDFRDELVAFALAVPPPSDLNENPRVPFYGALSDRAAITKLFNKILEASCLKQVEPKLHFFQPFAQFTSGDGTLNHAFSDGHVHVDSVHCKPIHQQLTAELAAI